VALKILNVYKGFNPQQLSGLHRFSSHRRKSTCSASPAWHQCNGRDRPILGPLSTRLRTSTPTYSS